jgi:formylglycine-generating enzyme required for sulfatase activity
LDVSRIGIEGQADYAQRLGENGNGMHAVGQKRANGFGLHDMLGNVWEWVNDWYDANYYKSSSPQDPTGPASGQLRVLRGGCWFHDAEYARFSNRFRFDPSQRDSVLGFRCGGVVFAP